MTMFKIHVILLGRYIPNVTAMGTAVPKSSTPEHKATKSSRDATDSTNQLLIYNVDQSGLQRVTTRAHISC